MFRSSLFSLSILLMALQPWQSLAADDAAVSPTETKLREALRNTMLQMRDVQNQLAVLQAAKDQADKDNADLKTQLDAANGTIKSLTDQAAQNKADWDKTKSDLDTQLAQKTGEIATLNDSLAQSQAAFTQTDSLAKATEAARQKLAIQVIDLQRLVSDRETKNVQLYQMSNDILTRYEKFSLGEALEAKEPFVGITRAKLENLVQGYKDKVQQGLVPSAPQSAMVTPKVQ
jgi:chromosome segregation ATPase